MIKRNPNKKNDEVFLLKFGLLDKCGKLIKTI